MSRRLSTTARAVFAVILVGVLAPPDGAGARPAQAQTTPPKSYIVVDETSGEVLAADREHEALPPASTAKIMTAIAAIERLPVDAMISVSELAAAQPASRINMVANSQWTFENAMASLMMVSANDAAYAIAESAGGSLQGFADIMNATAKRLHMRDSVFSDPAGFDDATSFGGGPRMSAYDIAISTRNARAVPDIAKWAATKDFEFDDPEGQHRTLLNHNKMVPGNSRAYEGTTGFKTGYTDLAGNTFVATATRNGCSLIVVVLGTWDTYGWATALLDQSFATNCEGGTGVRLPAVAVSPYSQRAADRDAFVAVAQGPHPSTTTTTPAAAAGPGETAAAPATPTSAATSDRSTLVGDTAPIASERDQGDGIASTRNLVVLSLALGVTAVLLRRRAVKRRRARRMAQRRARAAQMRSGGLPVVDGRYRSTRIGEPLESHVRVHRPRREQS